MVTKEQLRLAKAAAAEVYSPIARTVGSAASGAMAVKLAYDLGVFVAEHARGGGITQENIEAMFGNPAPAAPPAPTRKKRKANRYAILLKQEMKKSKMRGKTSAQRKKKFAAAAKKASLLYKKEKKDGKTKSK